jgi:hypothetical protein
MPWTEAFAVDAFVSSAYTWNANRPDDHVNALRTFDFVDDTIELDVAELVVQAPADEAGEVGFRTDLVAGSTIPRTTASSGLFRDPSTGVAGDFDLQQAYVSWIAPVGSGLRFDAGKMVTFTGAEYIEGYDYFNDNYSHSYLFGYAIPFTHTGVMASYAAGPIGLKAMVCNGWDVAIDNNHNKALGVGVSAAGGPASVYVNYIFSSEVPEGGVYRHLIDATAVVAGGPVTGTVNFDFGTEDGNTWMGVAGYVRADATGTFHVALRGEFFDDADGARTGTAQQLVEVTLTPAVTVGEHVTLRVEGRLDHSSEDVFLAGADPTATQITAAANALVAW